MCHDEAGKLGLRVDFRQSNHDGQLIDWIQEAGPECAAGRLLGAVLNPGALTHTSLALHDEHLHCLTVVVAPPAVVPAPLQ
jgi:3-dehydroquinate dehydratase II